MPAGVDDTSHEVNLTGMAMAVPLTTPSSTPTEDHTISPQIPQLPDKPQSLGAVHSETNLACAPNANAPPARRRRSTRGSVCVSPFKTVDDFNVFELGPGWHPGAEPGFDPTKPDGGHASVPAFYAPCDITVVDFHHDNITFHRLHNDSLIEFLDTPQPEWATCRWINVNGLSWDVIQALGQHKGLHKLAIEDIMNTRNRPKAEWFTTHAFIVLDLQKLVHVRDTESDTESDDESDKDETDYIEQAKGGVRAKSRRQNLLNPIKRWFRYMLGKSSKTQMPDLESGMKIDDTLRLADSPSDLVKPPTGVSNTITSQSRMRTLQRHHGHYWQPNDPRTEYMEKNSALALKKLAVAAEQVSMFLTDDNTLISFFEMSAQDIEGPIVRRLQTPGTILRQSCDASMLAQAVIDAIIDMAIPVTSTYQEVVGDLELDVVTSPNISHTKKLYIMITEINKMLSFIVPITTLINALRDHKTDMAQEEAVKHLQNPSKGVIITPMTCTYLGDVVDHSMLITEELNQIKSQGDDMINLIFNTISARQNESMKQLTLATIIFLPLTFLTGYFGMNFVPFGDLQFGIGFFWKIAIPSLAATIIILMRRMIWNSLKTLVQRYRIGHLRRIRKKKEKSRAKKRA